MNQLVELGRNINDLILLEEGDFDPSKHLSLAENIVAKYGKKDYFFRSDTLIKVERVHEIADDDADRASQFIIEYADRFTFYDDMGFYPKLLISQWKQRFMHLSGNSLDYLLIGYLRNEVKGIARLQSDETVLRLGRLNIVFPHWRVLWKYLVEKLNG